MNKRRHTKPFDAASKIAEKYLDTLQHAESKDTSVTQGASSPDDTGSSQPDTMAVPPIKVKKALLSDQTAKNIGLVSLIGIIVGIGIFFSIMNTTVNSIKSDVVGIKDTVGDFWREAGKYQEEIKGTTRLILEKLDNLPRLFNNSEMNRKNSSDKVD